MAKPTYEELEQAINELKKEAVERKREDKTLRESVEKYRLLVEQIPTVTYIAELDEASTTSHISLHVEKLLGFSQAEWTNDPDIWRKQLHPEDRERVLAEVARSHETDEPFISEYRMLTRDGHVVWFRDEAVKVRDTDGKPLYLHGVMLDITDHKRTEAALKSSETEKTAILDATMELLVYHDTSLKVIWANRAAAESVGLTAEKLVGRYCYEVWCRQNEPLVDCPAVQVIKTGQPHEIEISTPDGKYWIHRGYPVYDSKGSIAGVVTTVLDITDHKQAEEERKKFEAMLQESQKMEAIGTLAGGIAHDFNNLLMTIQGTASLMLYDVDSTHPHHELLQMITKQVRRGASLTAQLLGYASKGRYEVKPISLNRIVEETSDTFGRTHKEISIHRELTEDLSSIEADQSQIEQVLLNLYINASGAMPRGGTLTIKTMNVTHKDIKDIVHNPRSGSYVLLTVTDTGTGMNKKTRARIFEPFFTTKEMGRGTGLGLASAYGIIKGHRGYIHVDSKKGHGTTFSIYLPASDKKVVTAIKPAEHVIEGSGTILLVDDEDPVLDTGVMMLEKIGYTVFEAKGGREAVEIYEANKDKIDLVILDMIMPDIGGGEAYDRMKEINPDVKILLSSGYSIEGEATEILDRGCDGFIQKPFNIKELSGKIREFLDKG